jgi:hypothetical protein
MYSAHNLHSLLSCRTIAFLGDSGMRKMARYLAAHIDYDPVWRGQTDYHHETPRGTKIDVFFRTFVRT